MKWTERFVVLSTRYLAFAKHFDKEAAKGSLVGAVSDLYATWDEQALGMLTAARVKEQLKARHNLVASLSTIREVLKKALKLSYLKVKPLSLQTNSL